MRFLNVLLARRVYSPIEIVNQLNSQCPLNQKINSSREFFAILK